LLKITGSATLCYFFPNRDLAGFPLALALAQYIVCEKVSRNDSAPSIFGEQNHSVIRMMPAVFALHVRKQH
jgi:hypothetical protein